jgi:TonB family protein
MKRILMTAVALVVVAGAVAWAADSTGPLLDQVVMDRTNRDKTANDYVMLTRNEIQRAWTTPVAMNEAQAVKGRIRINYVISRSGALRSVELVRGSGNADLDRTLTAAIRAAAPFPPFPDEIRARSMLVRANFIVANTPTVRVTTVQHEVKKEASKADTGNDPSGDKKLTWGLPAGTSGPSHGGVDHEIPAPPATKRYKWGL